MGRRNHYRVYVIELSKDVLQKNRFMKANPDYVPGKLYVYVGMTGLYPTVRFDKHKAGTFDADRQQDVALAAFDIDPGVAAVAIY